MKVNAIEAALKLQAGLEPKSSASYFLAVRELASAALGRPVGKIIPVENEKDLERLDASDRPHVIAQREDDNQLFVLFFDTDANPQSSGSP